jgi:predicted DNA-binding ribbon-helix-helix protein
VKGTGRRPQIAGAPIKRSVSIAGHRTSLSLEPEFWEALQHAAIEESTSLAGLIAGIDAKRGQRNLSSAVRVWLLERVRR